jgi:type IV fimbrial biogenesis protein FimT
MLNAVRQRGFNLIEAVVTVSVLGILVAATIPSMSDWVRSTRVRSLMETTQSGLQKARTEAMKRNKVVTFWLVSPAVPDDTCTLATATGASGAWVVSLDNPAGNCGKAPSPTAFARIVEVYGPGSSSSNLALTAVDKDAAAANFVSFNGFGQRVGGGATQIDISDPGSTSVRPLRIQISASGGIRSCDPAVSTATDPRVCL